MGTTEGVNMKGEADKTVLPLGSKFHSSTARKWVGLTQEDINTAFEQMSDYEMYDEFAHIIEAKLREKNGGVAQPETVQKATWTSAPFNRVTGKHSSFASALEELREKNGYGS
jgi:hypothetical protein